MAGWAWARAWATILMRGARPQEDGHGGRCPARARLDHPVEILRLAGIKAGMHLADFMAGNGYHSGLLSYVVGQKGHVLLINNPSGDRWVRAGMAQTGC